MEITKQLCELFLDGKPHASEVQTSENPAEPRLRPIIREISQRRYITNARSSIRDVYTNIVYYGLTLTVDRSINKMKQNHQNYLVSNCYLSNHANTKSLIDKSSCRFLTLCTRLFPATTRANWRA